MRILIIDDSNAMRMIIKRVLRQTGVAIGELAEASNGVEGLESIRSERPDLVLCDWNMPEMDGLQLLHALRDEAIDVPFGFVTAESSTEMRDQALDAGAAFLITKPFTPAAVREALAGLLS